MVPGYKWCTPRFRAGSSIIVFNLFINDIEDGINSTISIFADDTKLCSTVQSMEEVHKLQADLNTLSDWASTWQMRFNVDKCKVMHLGSNNLRASYVLWDVTQRVTYREGFGCPCRS